MVKEKTEPLPGVLFTSILPPCISIRRLQMDNPRPVPPNFLVVLVVSWVNMSKMCWSLSGLIPIPVSATFYPENRFFGGLIKLVNAYGYFTFFSELDSIPRQVHQYLVQAVGSPMSWSGTSSSTSSRNSSPFSGEVSFSAFSTAWAFFTNTETDVLKHDLTCRSWRGPGYR